MVLLKSPNPSPPLSVSFSACFSLSDCLSLSLSLFLALSRSFTMYCMFLVRAELTSTLFGTGGKFHVSRETLQTTLSWKLCVGVCGGMIHLLFKCQSVLWKKGWKREVLRRSRRRYLLPLLKHFSILLILIHKWS